MIPTAPIIEGNLDCGYYETDENNNEVWHWVEELGCFDYDDEWNWYDLYGAFNEEDIWIWNSDLGTYDENEDLWTWSNIYGSYDENDAWHFYGYEQIFGNKYRVNPPPIVEGNTDCGYYETDENNNDAWHWVEELGSLYQYDDYEDWQWYEHLGGYFKGYWVWNSDMGEYDANNIWIWNSKYGEYDENDVWHFNAVTENDEPTGEDPTVNWHDFLGGYDPLGHWIWDSSFGFYDANGNWHWYDYYEDYGETGYFDPNNHWVWDSEDYGYYDEYGVWHFYTDDELEEIYQASLGSKLYFAYRLYDYCNKYGKVNAKDISDFKIEIFDEDLNRMKTWYSSYTEQGRPYGHFIGHENSTDYSWYYNGWRTVYTGEDNCWTAYRRDHKSSRLLAVNVDIEDPAKYIEERLSKIEVIVFYQGPVEAITDTDDEATKKIKTDKMDMSVLKEYHPKIDIPNVTDSGLLFDPEQIQYTLGQIGVKVIFVPVQLKKDMENIGETLGYGYDQYIVNYENLSKNEQIFKVVFEDGEANVIAQFVKNGDDNENKANANERYFVLLRDFCGKNSTNKLLSDYDVWKKDTHLAITYPNNFGTITGFYPTNEDGTLKRRNNYYADEYKLDGGPITIIINANKIDDSIKTKTNKINRFSETISHELGHAIGAELTGKNGEKIIHCEKSKDCVMYKYINKTDNPIVKNRNCWNCKNFNEHKLNMYKTLIPDADLWESFDKIK